jgi:LysR family glycine cleavage system transcriptional activator
MDGGNLAGQFPTIACLRAAEAVARHQSFSRAAIELNLTQTAVSHQIRKLEDLLGTRLFLRTHAAVRLTPAGEEYLAEIRPLIVSLVHASDRLASRRGADVITIGCPGTFLLKCLAARLSGFTARHPAVAVRIRTLSPYELGDPDRIGSFRDLDVTVRYGLGNFPGHEAYKVGDERIFPVCSPHLFPRSRPPELAELARHTVIRTTTPLLLRDDWPLWLETAGVPDLGFAGEITCDLLYSCFELAIQGMGIVMGRTPVASADLAAGRLIAPFPIQLASASGYHLAIPYTRARNELVILFRDWFLDVFRQPQLWIPPGAKA